MKEVKPVNKPLGGYFKISKKSRPSAEEKINKIVAIPYSSVIGSLMYDMVCTRLNIAHVVGVVSIFLANPGKEH